MTPKSAELLAFLSTMAGPAQALGLTATAHTPPSYAERVHYCGADSVARAEKAAIKRAEEKRARKAALRRLPRAEG
jgi:hypothetical protein